jgi:hypothetical protein
VTSRTCSLSASSAAVLQLAVTPPPAVPARSSLAVAVASLRPACSSWTRAVAHAELPVRATMSLCSPWPVPCSRRGSLPAPYRVLARPYARSARPCRLLRVRLLRPSAMLCGGARCRHRFNRLALFLFEFITFSSRGFTSLLLRSCTSSVWYYGVQSHARLGQLISRAPLTSVLLLLMQVVYPFVLIYP